MLTSFDAPDDFLAQQKKYPRVREAVKDKEAEITKRLANDGYTIDDFHLLIVAYKDDDAVELWVKSKQASAYKKLVTYDVCARSGKPGPKRKAGDYQVPEGFYHINRFNPNSNYYLSLGFNYPNESDKRKSTATDLGGDIFIHGACVTIGCLPMTDDKIKEIYLYAVHARNNGQQQIPVYVFPFRMTDKNMTKYKADYSNEKALLKFWDNLKEGYDQFEKTKISLSVDVDKDGWYVF